VGRMMKSGALAKVCAVLIALCYLLPMAALGAILFLDAPVLPTSLVGLFVVLLLAWRIFVLLSAPARDELRPLGNSSLQEGLPNHDYRQH